MKNSKFIISGEKVRNSFTLLLYTKFSTEQLLIKIKKFLFWRRNTHATQVNETKFHQEIE